LLDRAKFHRDDSHDLVHTDNYVYGNARDKKKENALQDEKEKEIRVRMTGFSYYSCT